VLTIRLDWPWWVSTVLAAGVAAGCLFALLRVRRPVVQGMLALLAVQAVALAIFAPFVMSEPDSPSMAGMSAGMNQGPSMIGDASPDEASTAADMPFTFFFTHYEYLGDPSNPLGVRYHSNGAPFADAPDGSTIAISGAGGWDPATARAEGGGGYVITNAAGDVTDQGTWTATDFVSFEQIPGWLPPGWQEEGWQGPPGSVSFAGFLEIGVTLSGRGDGSLTTWCLMSEDYMPPDHVSDGITVTGPQLDFTDYRRSEESFVEGVMFYGPASRSG
jgi:hypothetical protein